MLHHYNPRHTSAIQKILGDVPDGYILRDSSRLVALWQNSCPIFSFYDVHFRLLPVPVRSDTGTEKTIKSLAVFRFSDETLDSCVVWCLQQGALAAVPVFSAEDFNK